MGVLDGMHKQEVYREPWFRLVVDLWRVVPLDGIVWWSAHARGLQGALIQTRCRSLACRIPNITSRVVCSIDGFKNHATFGISRGIWKILWRVQLDLTRCFQFWNMYHYQLSTGHLLCSNSYGNWKFNQNSIWNPVEISLKYQWICIGNPVKNSMKLQ